MKLRIARRVLSVEVAVTGAPTLVRTRFDGEIRPYRLCVDFDGTDICARADGQRDDGRHRHTTFERRLDSEWNNEHAPPPWLAVLITSIVAQY